MAINYFRVELEAHAGRRMIATSLLSAHDSGCKWDANEMQMSPEQMLLLYTHLLMVNWSVQVMTQCGRKWLSSDTGRKCKWDANEGRRVCNEMAPNNEDNGRCKRLERAVNKANHQMATLNQFHRSAIQTLSTPLDLYFHISIPFHQIFNLSASFTHKAWKEEVVN